MNLTNPWDSKKGLKEKVNQLELLVLRHEGALRTLLNHFELERKYFDSITQAIVSVNPDANKKDSDTPSSDEQIVQP